MNVDINSNSLQEGRDQDCFHSKQEEGTNAIRCLKPPAKFHYPSVLSQVVVEGRDVEGLPFTFLKSVDFKADSRVIGKVNFGEGKPFECLVPERTRRVVVTLGFQAHYGEPPLDIPADIITGSGRWSQSNITTPTTLQSFTYILCTCVDWESVSSLEYNPFTREWTVQRSDDVPQLTAKLKAAKV